MARFKDLMVGRDDNSASAAVRAPRGSVVVCGSASLRDYTRGVISDAGGDDTKYHILTINEYSKALALRPRPPKVIITSHAMSLMNTSDGHQWQTLPDLPLPADELAPKAASAASSTSPRRSVLLKPIKDAPHNEVVLVLDPKQTPAVVAASYQKHYDGSGEKIWEAWVFADAMLADLYGAVLEPTHYMDMPKLEIPKADPVPWKAGAEPAETRLMDLWGKFPVTKNMSRPQALELLNYPHWNGELRLVTMARANVDTLFEDPDPLDPPLVNINDVDVVCPVIGRDAQRNTSTIVDLDGQLRIVQGTQIL